MHLSRLEPTRLTAIQPLFRSVFGHEISQAFLEWKYGNGQGESWVCQENNEQVVLHCGIFFRDIVLAGSRFRIAQLVDLMAGPKQSGLSRKDSPFAVLMRQVLTGLPEPTNPDALAFGFPSDRAMRLGEKVGVFRAVDEWFELSFPARAGGSIDPSPETLVSFDASCAKVTDELWLAMAADLSDYPLGVRDAAYVARRYFLHPEYRYCCLLVRSRWLRRPIGIAVLRGADTDFELLDIIGPLSAMPDVLRRIQSWLHRRGGGAFRWNLTSRFAKRFAPFAASCKLTEFRIMANPFSSPSVLEKFDHTWWLTGGDTDYR